MEGPPSELQGTKVRLPLPCGHAAFYPESLVQKAMHEGSYHVFHTQCTECGTAYLVATEDDGAHVRSGGPVGAIIDRYEDLPWEEYELADVNGVFFCKRAPSLTAIRTTLSVPASAPPGKIGRNDPCHCGSGKKYKKCHLDQDEAARRESARPADAVCVVCDKPVHLVMVNDGPTPNGIVVNAMGKRYPVHNACMDELDRRLRQMQ